MATTGIVNGTLFKVYVGSTAIAGGQVDNMSMSHSPRDATTKDSAGSEESLEGMLSWGMSSDYLVALDAAYGLEDLFDAWLARTQVTIKFSTSVSGDTEWTGSAYIESLDVGASNEESVTGSVSFKGTGALAKATIT